jgi:hypothetical protein
MIDKTKWEGKWIITTKNKVDGKITQETVKNRVMDSALDALANCLLGITPDFEVAYMALGTGNSPISDLDVTLNTEIFRTAPTVAPVKTNTGEITTEFTLLDSEAVATIEEIGIFCGSSATASANTGNLLSRILWRKVKTANEEISFKRIDKIQRG